MNLKGTRFKNDRLNMEINVYDVDGIKMFLGTETAILLGYKNPSDTIYKKVWGDNKKKIYVKCIENTGHMQNAYVEINSEKILINESGLYQLIFSSKLSCAIEFQKWIFNDVLPSLRENNTYIDSKNITTSQREKAIKYLLDLCDIGKISLGRASKKIFGNQTELKNRLINLGWIDFDNCTFKQQKFLASNKEIYDLFVVNMSGKYDDGVASHMLQVSVTTAGYIWLKDMFEKDSNFGLKIN